MEKPKYRLEIVAEKFLIELTRLVRDFRHMFFRIPKNKMDKYIFLFETTAWLSLGIALVLRLFR